jgi:hypothetical protein
MTVIIYITALYKDAQYTLYFYYNNKSFTVNMALKIHLTGVITLKTYS